MVYARAIVAGFDTDNLQDLICFADAFGSPRLREACLNFIELCNTKSNDRVWIDEVAAMQAYSHSHSHSHFSYMEDEIGQELRINFQNTNNKHNGSGDGHESHITPHMPSYQWGPMFQPPYQAYPFPWPPNKEVSRSRKKHVQDVDFDSSDSSSGSDSGRNKRSSSHKVIVKKINYITFAGDGRLEHESDDSSLNDDNVIEDKREDQKATQQWNIFENLLLKDADEEEEDKPSDRANTFEEEFVSNKFEDPNTLSSRNQPEFANKSSTNEKREEGDWFMRSLPDKVIQEESRDIFVDHIKSKDVVVNNPLAVQARSLIELPNSQIRTHDIIVDSESNVIPKRVETTSVNEPNDLFLVLERDTGGKQAVASWTPEMESGNSNYTKIVKVDSAKVNESKDKVFVRKGSTNETKSKALVGSRSKKSTETKTAMPKGISNKEDEKRKKTEELISQRQKRIAERSASSVKITKSDNQKAEFPSRNEIKSNKPVIKKSTIDRLSTARVVNTKVLPTPSKLGTKPTKVIPNRNSEPKPVTKVATNGNNRSHTLVSQSTVAADKKKVKMDNVKPQEKKISSKNLNGQKKIADVMNAKKLPKTSLIKKTDGTELSTPAKSNNTEAVIKVSHKPSSVHVKDIALPDSNGGSAIKAINSVTFRIDPNHGAKANNVVKVNHEVPVIPISVSPPGKQSPEKSNSKKKWISGFKKLLSFGGKKLN
ncbi:COP1-interacting protein 7-like isoform X2 [Rutidosis leptorrhynchoides]